MRPTMILRTLALCSFVLFFQGAWAYRKYYVEDECVSPTEYQKIEIPVPGTGQDSVGELQPNRFGTYSRTGRKCLVKLVPPEGYGIVLTIISLDFRNKIDCKDYIKIGESGKRLCDLESLDEKSFLLDSDATFLYHTSEGGIGWNKGFKFVFTVSKLAVSPTPCPEGTFTCDNGRCIWNGVKCDGVDNCGDGSDERRGDGGCPNVMATITMVSIILAILSSSFLVVVMCMCCCRSPMNVKPMRPYTPLVGYGTIAGDMIPSAPPQHYFYEKPPPYSMRAEP